MMTPLFVMCVEPAGFSEMHGGNVIFTSGCTEALNLAILGTIQTGGNVVYCSNSHNSVARPLEYLKSKNLISTTLVKTDKTGKMTAEKIENAITDKTYLVVVNHTSNVTGTTSNIKEIARVCKKHNCLFLVDGAQSAGHIKIDMKNDGISMLAVAGHKGLLASQGVGALLFDPTVKINPQKFGGTGTNSELLLPPITYPDSLEAGTSPTPAIFSLFAGTKYVKKHFEKINKKISKLSKYLIDELSKKNGVTLLPLLLGIYYPRTFSAASAGALSHRVLYRK